MFDNVYPTTHIEILTTGALCPKGSEAFVTSREMNECGFALFRSIVVVESAFPKVKFSKFRVALHNTLKNNLVFPVGALQDTGYCILE